MNSIMNRKSNLENEKRLKTTEWLNRWEVFRREKLKYLDYASGIIKQRNLVKRWVGFMVINKTLSNFIENYGIWHERNI